MLTSDNLQIRFWESLYWSCKNNSQKTVARKLLSFIRYHSGVIVYPQVNFKNSDGILNVKKRLALGKVHELASYKMSDFLLFENSEISVDNFTFFTGFQVVVNKNARLSIGSGYANYSVKIDCFEEIRIGQNVAISHNVIIRDSDNHQITGQKNVSLPIKIGNHVWIGMNSTVLKGVNIGDGSVIGAGSVVTRDIPAGCLAVGVPARVIRSNIEWK